MPSHVLPLVYGMPKDGSSTFALLHLHAHARCKVCDSRSKGSHVIATNQLPNTNTAKALDKIARTSDQWVANQRAPPRRHSSRR